MSKGTILAIAGAVAVIFLVGYFFFGIGKGEQPQAQTFGFLSEDAIMESAFGELKANAARQRQQEAYEKELLRPGYEVIKYFDDLERAWDGFDGLSGELKGKAGKLSEMIGERMKALNQRLNPNPVPVQQGGGGQ